MFIEIITEYVVLEGTTAEELQQKVNFNVAGEPVKDNTGKTVDHKGGGYQPYGPLMINTNPHTGSLVYTQVVVGKIGKTIEQRPQIGMPQIPPGTRLRS